jgi:RNA polymerase sigma-70 factor (ECF subfamily)
MEKQDWNLVQDCVNGDNKAFESLVDRYQKVIFNIAFRMTKDSDESADITQSVFIKVYENLDSFNASHKFFSWLYRIAVNESLNHIKQGKNLDNLDNNFISNEKSPEQVVNENEKSNEIQQALLKIDVNYRIVIVLKHFQDFSYKEIGEILDISEKTVKSRLFTARQLLKDILLKKR